LVTLPAVRYFFLESNIATPETPFVISALLVAAGRGVRMGTDTDKLFFEVSGAPIVAHTWERLDEAESIDEIVLVIRDGARPAFEALAATLELDKPYRFVVGGKERQDSVWNGLQAIAPTAEIVAIQDAARPCTPLELIEDTIEAARETGAAVAAQRVTDTIKQSDDARTISRHLDRSLLWAVQTPQTFRVEVIRRALHAVREKGLLVTDDTAACELINQPVRLVECAKPNPKVTVPADLPYIELLLR
jgi:2-C-methyl-D-erythritol 4-phosphate cytidylyltransferase